MRSGWGGMAAGSAPQAAIAASQAKMGENSYYYSVGKNRGTPAPAVAPAKPVAVVSVAPDAKQLPEATIQPKQPNEVSYS